MFDDKKILVGLTGSIACYKTCDVIRDLIKMKAATKVVMTEAATQFITPLTLETLSNHSVSRDLFGNSTIHIDLAREADCILVCPATANTINKIANGIADNLLTALIMAATVPVIFCPAMNKEMYLNPIFQQSMKKLQALGYLFVEPEKGELACGEYGWGRLAEKLLIIDYVKKALLGTDELQGKKIVVSAGRTEESLDPVRFITNRSTGKMGFALAEFAALKGADVTLVSGPNDLHHYFTINYRPVQTAKQMADAVFEEIQTADILIMAAAVADFRPKMIFKNKIKKQTDLLNFELEKTTDILYEVGKNKGKRILVGFALETENGSENAIQKLRQKNLDLIVLNNPLEQGAGFGGNTNRVTIFNRHGDKFDLPLMSKFQVAEKIMDHIINAIRFDG